MFVHHFCSQKCQIYLAWAYRIYLAWGGVGATPTSRSVGSNEEYARGKKSVCGKQVSNVTHFRAGEISKGGNRAIDSLLQFSVIRWPRGKREM